ncbi:hypothetical protein MJO28_005314 [Puccinia striiformis f. sp. tritici]|uniref:Uncharacterized protein n=1 Tax=Puccinia striiformis f. sp. tritici TaxID=168172 RepID=A0ACC0EKB6_9BASI|nr:hypothetical protein MJO28_005314 [Puccinia striiformis f. sp. tritici]
MNERHSPFFNRESNHSTLDFKGLQPAVIKLIDHHIRRRKYLRYSTSSTVTGHSGDYRLVNVITSSSQ